MAGSGLATAQLTAPQGVGTFGITMPYTTPTATLHLQTPTNTFLRITNPIGGAGAVDADLLSGSGSSLGNNRDVVLRAYNDARNLIFTTVNEFSGSILFATQEPSASEELRMKIHNNGKLTYGLRHQGWDEALINVTHTSPDIKMFRHLSNGTSKESVTFEIVDGTSWGGFVNAGDFLLTHYSEDNESEDIILAVEQSQYGSIVLGVRNLPGTGWTTGLTVTDEMQVGIGTQDPGSYKLAVEGAIGAREIEVLTTSPWPDYVFEPEYSLMPLDSLELSIRRNGHLPGVPSAEEVEANRLNLGEMQGILLEKIEELTLYTIEQNKRIEALQEECRVLRSMASGSSRSQDTSPSNY